MSTLLMMVRKDLRRSLRAPLWMVITLIFPLAFAGMLGLAFGRRGGGGLPRIKVLVADEDKAFLSNLITSAGNNPDSGEMFEFIQVPSAEEGRRRMENGEASGLIIIPDRFTEDLIDEHRPATLTVVKNPSESILPQVVEELVGVEAVYLDNGVRLLGAPLRDFGDAFEGVNKDATRFPADTILTSLTVGMASKVRPLLHYVAPPAVVFTSLDEAKAPLPAVLRAAAGETRDQLEKRIAGSTAATATTPTKRQEFNIFALLLPMVSVMSLLFMGESGMRDLLEEQRTGTLKRQFASPAGVGTVLGAKVVLTLLICAAAMLLLGIVGVALGWIPITTSLPGALVQVAALAFAATGLGALIYGFVRTERAARATYSAVAMAMSFLGGSFVPLTEMPPGLRAVGHATINYWGVEGLTDLTVRGGGLAAVLPDAAVLAGFGVVGLLLGWMKLSRRFAAGAAAR